MNTKIGLAAFIVIILVLIWTAFRNPSTRNVDVNTTDNGSAMTTTNSNENSQWIPSVSFGCKDGTHFIAEFPDENKLNVVVDGKVARTIPHTQGSGKRYEDSAFVYVFAGEEVTVTNKIAKKSTTCEQPRDPNNAPMNFGDAGEGGAGFAPAGAGSIKVDASLVVKESIVGTWKSDQDAKFSREFTSSGTVIDFYDGKSVTTGNWQIFTGEKPLKVSFPVEKDAVYVQMTISGSQSDTLNFKLLKLTPEKLELVYMERGNVNVFTRVK